MVQLNLGEIQLDSLGGYMFNMPATIVRLFFVSPVDGFCKTYPAAVPGSEIPCRWRINSSSAARSAPLWPPTQAVSVPGADSSEQPGTTLDLGFEIVLGIGHRDLVFFRRRRGPEHLERALRRGGRIAVELELGRGPDLARDERLPFG